MSDRIAHTPPPARALFGIQIHALRMADVVDWVYRTIAERDGTCRYIVTPNVDHIVQLQANAELQSAYRSASLVVADGWPLVAASRLLRRPLPERVAGSDLVPQLLAQTAKRGPMSIFLLGAAPGVGERAARKIRKDWPQIEIRGVLSPPFGFEQDDAENTRIVDAVNACSPDLLIVGLGAPKQELWLRRHRELLTARVAVAAGATIDFIGGQQRRAPKWVRRMGFEWLHRLVHDPRRLAKRYAYDACVFPKLVATEFVRSWNASYTDLDVSQSKA